MYERFENCELIHSDFCSLISFLGYAHTAPFLFLSVVFYNAVRSHCSVFKWICHEDDRLSHCACKAVLLIILSKQCPIVSSFEEVTTASLNAIVINGLSTNDCKAFSNVSVFCVHTENGSFSKRTIFKFMHFYQRFTQAPFSQQSDVNAKPKWISFTPFSHENGGVR